MLSYCTAPNNRGDNEWLSRPRTSDWFTGLEPSICPGKFCIVLQYTIRIEQRISCDICTVFI